MFGSMRGNSASPRLYRAACAILLSGAISMCGCTTLRTVAPTDLQGALDGLRAGDSVAVRAAGVWHDGLTVTGATGSVVQAEGPGGERVTFARSEVDELKVRVRAPGRTVGLAVGIFFGMLGSGIPGLSL